MTDEPAKDLEFARPVVLAVPTATRIYINNRWHRRDGNMHGRPPYYLDNASGLLVLPS